MKKKRYIIICLILILLLIGGYYIFHMITTSKTDVTTTDPIIDKKEITFENQETVASVEIVGELGLLQQLVAILDGKRTIIYETDQEQLDSIDLFQQLDIDHDGEKEIIITVYLRGNSLRYKLFILKQNFYEYTPLNLVYPNSQSNTGFQINAYLDNEVNNIIIKNTAFDKTYTISITDHYPSDVFADNGSSLYELFLEENYSANEEIGGQVWVQQFTVVTKDGVDYFIAQQYIQGAFGAIDTLGIAYTTFSINEDGTMHIIDFEFVKNEKSIY